MFSKQLLTVLSVLVFTVSNNAEVPNLINYQGYLTDDTGTPIEDGPYLVKFIIYDAASGGTEIWNAGFQTITTSSGLFSYQLGSNVPLPIGLFSDTNRYLGITIGTDSELTPRSRFITMSYAFKAQNADLASTAVSAFNADNADALAGEDPEFYLNWGDMINVPPGFADGVDDVGLGDITSVTAGNGLSGGGTSGSVTLVLAATITSSHTFNNLKIDTTKRKIAISHAAFAPAYNTTVFSRFDEYLRNNSTGTFNFYRAPVFLPDNAIITEVECMFYDNDATYNAAWELYGFNSFDFTKYVISTGSTTGSSSFIQTLYDTTFVQIDNENHFYTLRINLQSSSVTSLRFYGAEIEYVITEPLP